MGSEQEKISIAIVGGGICGLALAAGLCKLPALDVHVYEAVKEYKDVGAGLALHLNAIKAMASIGPEVRQAYVDAATNKGEEEQEMVTEVILAHGPDKGKLVAELGRAKGRKSVSRADLLAGFLKLIPEGCIEFDKRLTGVTDLGSLSGMDLTWQDGTSTTVDCVLGADGIHSVVRRFLLDENHPDLVEPINTEGWQVYRTLVSGEEARKCIRDKWTRNVGILMGPKGHINTIPLNKGTRLSAGVAIRGAAVGGKSLSLDPELYSDYSDEAQEIVRLVTRDTSASWAVGELPDAPYYSSGLAAMVGDAAHASLPFAGQGAAQALEDAAVLVHIFREMGTHEKISSLLVYGGDSLERTWLVGLALYVYSHVRRRRTQEVADLARRFGRVYAYDFAAATGREGERVSLVEFFGEAAKFTNDFDVEWHNQHAAVCFTHMAMHLGVELQDGLPDGLLDELLDELQDEHQLQDGLHTGALRD